LRPLDSGWSMNGYSVAIGFSRFSRLGYRALAPPSIRLFKKEPTRDGCSFCGLIDFHQIVLQLGTKIPSATELVARIIQYNNHPHFIHFAALHLKATTIEFLQGDY
jgi:hypothetical protein